MDDVFRELFGWVVGIGMLLAGAALGLMVAGLVHLAAGAGAGRDEPLPPGVLRHAQELEARLRRRYMPRPEPVESPEVWSRAIASLCSARMKVLYRSLELAATGEHRLPLAKPRLEVRLERVKALRAAATDGVTH